MPRDVPMDSHNRRGDREDAEPDVPGHTPARNGSDHKFYYPMLIPMPTNRFESWDEVVSLVSEFESGQLPHARWNHREHLTVGFWYCSRLDEAAATDRIREGILFLNSCHGTPNTDTRGYHETLTRFWISIVAKFLKDSDGERAELEL